MKAARANVTFLQKKLFTKNGPKLRNIGKKLEDF